MPNYDALFSRGKTHVAHYSVVREALIAPERIWYAFSWRSTKQGMKFWSDYSAGINQEEGRAILRLFLNEKQITLEDVL